MAGKQTELISIDKELQRLCKLLAEGVNEFSDLIIDAADKRTVYDTEYAKAVLQTDGSTREKREAEALSICQGFMRDARIAEAMRDAMKERIRALATVLSVQQSRLKHFEESERIF